MAFTLEVRMDFLCVLVGPFEGPDNKVDFIDVFLPDLREQSNEEERHFPALLYDPSQRSFTDADRPPDDYPNKPDDEEREVFALDRETIVLEASSQGGVEVRDSVRRRLLTLDRAYPELAEIHPQPEEAVARMRIETGSLCAHEITDCYQIFKKDEYPGGEPINDGLRIARQIVWTIPGLDQATFKFCAFDSGEETRLKLESSLRTVSVTLRNAELSGIWSKELPPTQGQSSDEMNLVFPYAKNYDPSDPPDDVLIVPLDKGAGGICAPKGGDRPGG